jgi:hypothetical protein
MEHTASIFKVETCSLLRHSQGNLTHYTAWVHLLDTTEQALSHISIWGQKQI